MSENPRVVFVLGGPGAGKGTQCGRVVEKFGWKHLSAGDLLREEIASGSPQGDTISSLIKEGKIVPVEITVELLDKAMQKSKETNFLIDGFPRNQDNLDGWNRRMEGKANVLFCLFFECSEKTMENRILERSKTSGRSDDNVESIRKRFRTYIESTMPIVEQFRSEQKLRVVNAERSVDEVFAEVSQIFGEL